ASNPAVLVVAHDASVLDDQIALPVAVVVLVDRHQSERARFQQAAHYLAVVRPQIRVSVRDEERILKQRRRPPQGSCRPEELRPVVGVTYPDAEASAVAEVLLDDLTEVADAEHEVV